MMKKKRMYKHNSRSNRTYAALTNTSSHASVYDFTDDGAEQEDRITASKYAKTSPEGHPPNRPVDKYDFLELFRRRSTGPEIDSDVSDNFVGNRRQGVEKSPVPLMKSLSISLSTDEVACSTRGNAGVCNTKKNKHVLHLESDDDHDGVMDLQTSTHLYLTEDQGSLEERSSPHGSVEIVRPEGEPAQPAVWGNRLASNGVQLDYEGPVSDDTGLYVSLSADDVAEETQKWKHCLVVYVVGSERSLSYMEGFAEKAWGELALPVLHQYDSGFFVARFNTAEECDLVLSGAPYTLENQPVILKPWTPDFDYSAVNLTVLSLWVKFPKLPLHFWGKKSLSKLASIIGKPIRTDECTAEQYKVSSARVLIDVDVSQPLVKSIRIKCPNSGMFEQAVEYEWVPVLM